MQEAAIPRRAGPALCNVELLSRLRELIGSRHVLTGEQETLRYRTGFRSGSGPCLATLRPGSLLQLWHVLNACVAAEKIVIMQAANTGLTGGSTPSGSDYDRDVVIISTSRLTGIQVINEGTQAICLPGATLSELEQALAAYGREPHSVIGSSCIGASVIGGISNNSGGALVRRGPAFTQMALYAQLNADGELTLVNHLGVKLGEDPVTVLSRLQRGDYTAIDIESPGLRRTSDDEYAGHVRDVDADSPARYNADPRRLFEASGCAGKLAVFAVRVDTFPKDVNKKLFYIGTNDPQELTRLRRHVLREFLALPVAAEYLHRDAFDIAASHGKDMFLAIRWLKTHRLPALLALKGRLDRVAHRLPFLPTDFSDRLLQFASRFFPQHLPPRLCEYRRRYEHYLMLHMEGASIDAARSYLAGIFPSSTGDFFECTPEEASKAFLHRFVTAGAAIRYRAIHSREVEDIVALDIALRRNDLDWFERLPPDLDRDILHKLYYGHFFCHVFHQDYVIRKGVDREAFEHALWALLDQRGAKYPAEHNVGHLYHAAPLLQDFYRSLDPCNAFNSGLGMTSKRRHWSPATETLDNPPH